MSRKLMMFTDKKDTYVENGLMLYLDCSKNTRLGFNDKSSVWEDLSGNNLDFINYGCTFLNSGVVFDGSSYLKLDQIKELQFDSLSKNINTIEVVATNRLGTTSIIFISYYKNIVLGFTSDVMFNATYNSIMFKPEWATKDMICSYSSTSYDESNKGSNKLYLNGQSLPLSSRSDSWSVQSGNGVSIGKRITGSEYSYNGVIKCVRLYNRKLEENEILHNYNLDKIKFNI